MTDPLEKAPRSKKRFTLKRLLFFVFIITMVILFSIIFADHKVKTDRTEYCESNEGNCKCISYKEITREEIPNYNKYYVTNGEPFICNNWCRGCS